METKSETLCGGREGEGGDWGAGVIGGNLSQDTFTRPL